MPTQLKAYVDQIVHAGFHPKLGMRPMRHAVETLVGDAVARELLAEKPGCGLLVVEANSEALIVQPK